MSRRPTARPIPTALQAWPATQTTLMRVADLLPYARNARTHSPEQVEQIVASIREFGFTNPVLVDEANNIIAGHGRVMALKEMGHEQVPVMVARGWSEAQRRAYVLADNKLALNAGWDEALLALEIKDLQGLGFDLSLTGFSSLEISALFPEQRSAEDEAADQDAPEVPPIPTSQRGDTWILGRHRIRCGDSTVREDVAALLADAKPHLMVTDPPYGVSYDADWRNKAMRANGKAVGGRATGKVQNDDRADWREAWALFPGHVAYVWHAGRYAGPVAESLEATKFGIRSQIIWVKSNFAIGRADYHWKHEPCWYAVRDGHTAEWASDRKQTTVWEIAKPAKSETGHSTQKPVECMRRPILNNSKAGQSIYEPFSGSGTTIIACEMTNRSAIAMELDPGYVDVAVLRWQQFTGRQATLEAAPGRTFAEVAAERAA